MHRGQELFTPRTETSIVDFLVGENFAVHLRVCMPVPFSCFISTPTDITENAFPSSGFPSASHLHNTTHLNILLYRDHSEYKIQRKLSIRGDKWNFKKTNWCSVGWHSKLKYIHTVVFVSLRWTWRRANVAEFGRISRYSNTKQINANI